MSKTESNTVKLLDYTLLNAEKFNRAVYGVVLRRGEQVGGVGENASDMEKLAEYDRLGGAIRMGKNRVKMGSFYDFKARKPRVEPKVVFEFRDLSGELVELSADEEVPLELKAAQIAEEKKVQKNLAKLAEKEAKKKKQAGKDEVSEEDAE